ncbi:MAG TPA: TCP-1/cpn60 chaperonin family protein, partial [Myxococcota bacterium]|nr:TCP-1/cpn60 chaperonin family protein [Myxococcota bacterium]
AATEVEMKEKKARVEDALNATRAAAEEGVVAGGGVALIRAQAALQGLKLGGDADFGVSIIREACEAPLRIIAENAGEDASIIVHKVREGQGAWGWNGATGAFGDMFGFGVIDPTKVTRTALQNAASVAGLLLTTEAMIATKEKKDEDAD